MRQAQDKGVDMKVHLRMLSNCQNDEGREFKGMATVIWKFFQTLLILISLDDDERNRFVALEEFSDPLLIGTHSILPGN